MRSLSCVKVRSGYGRAVRWLLSILAILLIVPRYAGGERVPAIGATPAITATPYVPKDGWPKRIGALEPVGAVTLSSHDGGWGGFSSIALWQGRAILLSDSGNVASFAIRRGRVEGARGAILPSGPGVGWDRPDRDSESLTLDPVTGRAWVGFENQNELWRYSPGFVRAERHVAPTLMRKWARNIGAESLVRLRDGRFVVFAERKPNRRTRFGVLFDGDPVIPSMKAKSFRLAPPDRYDPSDAAELPNGDLLILTRRFQYPFRFTAKLLRVPRAELRSGHVAKGRVIATLAPPLIGENCEGIAISREHGATMVWIVTDNDAMFGRPTYLMKFRLTGD